VLIGLLLAAVTVFDFGGIAPGSWRVGVGRAPDAAVADSQCAVRPDGLHVRFDRSFAKPGATYGSVHSVPRARPELPVDATVRLFCRIPDGSLVSRPFSLTVVDADGETFRYEPTDRRIESGGRFVATYRVVEGGHAGAYRAGRPVTGGTGGTNRNDRLDAPLHLNSLSFGWRENAASGEVVLERMECRSAASCSCVCREDIRLEPDRDTFRAFNCTAAYSNGILSVSATVTNRPFHLRYDNFPGMKPFAGTDDLVLRTSLSRREGAPGTKAAPADDSFGHVTVTLLEPATGRELTLTRLWREETHFTTNLSHAAHYQLRRLTFRPAHRAEAAGPLAFRLLGLETVRRETEADACRLDVDTGSPIHVLTAGSSRRPVLTLKNPADRPLHWKGALAVRDFRGKGPTLAVDHAVPAGGTLRLEIADRLAKGIWRVSGELSGADGSVARPETRFAILDAHPVTPRLPRGACFRMGINYHAARFSPVDRELTMDALAAVGCKLARVGGFGFDAIEPQEGKVSWSRADAIESGLARRGISIDATIYSPPRWAQDAARVKAIGHRKAGQTATRPGLLAAHAARVAARYGTKIDYYEIGNEWDLFPAEVMSTDEAIALVREAVGGVRRSCPAAKVMPCGWAFASSVLAPKRPDVQDGLQERVMSAVRDEVDFHAVHLHGAFAGFRTRLDAFSAMRRAQGLDRLPWYANETALSSVNGEEDTVARTVFRKIMYAWAKGSVAYIWYNLKATGWVPNDAEQAYGLMTADFHPRAGYAAFSAFTAVYLGLAFDRELIVDGNRMAFAFRGTRDGRATVVLGGWDEDLTSPTDVPVETDAVRAWLVDLMGNRRPLTIADGKVVWPLEADPTSLVLEGATRAEPLRAALFARSSAAETVKVIPPDEPGRAPDFVLDTQQHVRDLLEAVPEWRDRLWKGPADHAAKLWLARAPNGLRVRAEVTDDVRAPGDGLEVFLSGVNGRCRTFALKPNGRTGTVDLYEAVLPFAETEFRFDVHVLEDDGQGPDGWLFLRNEVDGLQKVRMK